MNKLIILLFIIVSGSGAFFCKNPRNGSLSQKQNPKDTSKQKLSFINPEGQTIATRFLLPEGFQRVGVETGSFGEYLRNVELKADGTKARLFNGALKEPQDVYAAVINLDVGTRDLQQCADAVMRLRGEYYFKTKQIDKIQFHFTNGSLASFSKYAEGYRTEVAGNKVTWVKKAKPDFSYAAFRSFMDVVFMYAGTLSLEKELVAVPDWENIAIGDVVIYGGSPGHCVIVTDMAKNEATGEKIFLIAQSWMPAQDIHILTNPQMQPGFSPWYSNRFEGGFYTAECAFEKKHLKRWE